MVDDNLIGFWKVIAGFLVFVLVGGVAACMFGTVARWGLGKRERE